MNSYTKYDRFQTMAEAVAFLQKYSDAYNVIDYQFLTDNYINGGTFGDTFGEFAPYRYIIVVRFTEKREV